MPTEHDWEADPIEAEVVHLWTDFAHELRYAECNPVPTDPTTWSTGMLGLADRLGRLIGEAGHPTSWRNVQPELLTGGWWEAVHERADLPVPPSS
jgi:hypothetical protein